MLSTILVPLDGSPLAERVLPCAEALARKSSARILLLHARSALGVTREQMSEIVAVEEINDITARLKSAGLNVEERVYPMRDENVGRVIVDHAREKGATLIVMSTHGRGGLGRWVYGSVADQVLRTTTVPLLVIPATCELLTPKDGSLRVLVPLDGSQLAEAALGPACELVDVLGGELLLCRAVGPLEYSYAEGVAYLKPGVKPDVTSARAYLESVAGRIGASNRSVDLLVEVGPPVSTIVNCARRREADLIAMATHGRGGLARFALGSVATGTLQRAGLPMLLVRTPASA